MPIITAANTNLSTIMLAEHMAGWLTQTLNAQSAKPP
jgi:choline dehydrogenase-like flavoprotein